MQAELAMTAATMTSLEIAALVDSRHDKVKQSIERLAERGAISLPPMGEVSNDGPGPKTIAVFLVGKRDSYVIVAQLSPEFTARLVDRWQELEERERPAVLNLRDPKQLAAAALQLIEVNEELQAKVQTMQATVSAHHRIAVAEGSSCITDTAKALQMRPKDLFTWLSGNRWIYRRVGGPGWLAYQDRIQQGVLEHKITTVERSDGSERVVEQVLVTRKGLARLAEVAR